MTNIFLLSLNFCKDKRGAIAISLAFILPTLIGFFSIAVDGSRFNAERSRLNDALNQSVYAVAVANNQNSTDEDEVANAQLAGRYLSYYLPDKEIKTEKITVSARTIDGPDDGTPTIPEIEYRVNTSINTTPIFNLSKSDSSSFNAKVKIRGNGLSGVARRSTQIKSVPGDYVFVVNFSGAMSNTSVEPGLTQEQLLKKIVRTVGNDLLKFNDGSTVGIVPFSNGVPVILNRTNYASDTSKEYGCSSIGKLKDGYDDIDWSFWYNKHGQNLTPATSANKTAEAIALLKTRTNALLEQYYYKIAALNGYEDKNKDKAATDWLISKGYCRHMADSSIVCDADVNSDMYIHNVELTNNYEKFRIVALNEASGGSIVNLNTIDFTGTVSGDYLFKESNVRNIIQFQGADVNIAQGALSRSCRFASPIVRNNAATLTTITKPSYYLLPLTNDKAVFDELDKMIPYGDKDSLTGLLRSVPLIAQGKNPRKIIFVISGEDEKSPYLRKKLMEEHKLCNVIKEGLKKYPEDTKTEQAEIYYISLVNYLGNYKKTADYWGDYCVGRDKVFIGNNIDALIQKLNDNQIFSQEEVIKYINPNDYK